jgi:hypothetical protein
VSQSDKNAPKGEQERAKHRAQLEAVRAAFAAKGEHDAGEPVGDLPAADELPPDAYEDEAYEDEYLPPRLAASVRELERRQRRTSWLAGGAILAFAVGGAALLGGGLPAVVAQDEIHAREIRADRVAVTGDLRLLDADGNELAVLGREGGAEGSEAGAPVVLALKADGDPSREILRLAASNTGAAVSLDSPSGDSSVSLLSMPSGPSLELRSGEKSRRLSSEPSAAAASAPAASTAPQRAVPAPEVPTWTPRRDEVPTSGIAELRDIGHGFLVSNLTVAPVSEGVVAVRGRVVNTSAVAHAGLAFRVRMGDAAGDFTIYRISPGNSTGFSVELPGAGSGTPEQVSVEYVGSTVAFQATSTEPLYGRHVPGH